MVRRSAVITSGHAAGALMPPLGCVLCHTWKPRQVPPAVSSPSPSFFILDGFYFKPAKVKLKGGGAPPDKSLKPFGLKVMPVTPLVLKLKTITGSIV